MLPGCFIVQEIISFICLLAGSFCPEAAEPYQRLVRSCSDPTFYTSCLGRIRFFSIALPPPPFLFMQSHTPREEVLVRMNVGV